MLNLPWLLYIRILWLHRNQNSIILVCLYYIINFKMLLLILVLICVWNVNVHPLYNKPVKNEFPKWTINDNSIQFNSIIQNYMVKVFSKFNLRISEVETRYQEHVSLLSMSDWQIDQPIYFIKLVYKCKPTCISVVFWQI